MLLHAFDVVGEHAPFVVLMRATILPLLTVISWDFSRLWLPPVSRTLSFSPERELRQRDRTFDFAETLSENDGCSFAPKVRRNFNCFPHICFFL